MFIYFFELTLKAKKNLTTKIEEISKIGYQFPTKPDNLLNKKLLKKKSIK